MVAVVPARLAPLSASPLTTANAPSMAASPGLVSAPGAASRVLAPAAARPSPLPASLAAASAGPATPKASEAEAAPDPAAAEEGPGGRNPGRRESPAPTGGRLPGLPERSSSGARFWDGARELDASDATPSPRTPASSSLGHLAPGGRVARGPALDSVSVGETPTGGPETIPLPWSKTARYATLAATLGSLALVPALLRVPLASFSVLGIVPSWRAFFVVAAALTLAGIPLRSFTQRLAPWNMTIAGSSGGVSLLGIPHRMLLWFSRRFIPQAVKHETGSPSLFRKFPLNLPEILLHAAVEELLFRQILFLGGALALTAAHVPALAAYAASALFSSLFFALAHGYGLVWSRVVGGLLYAGTLLATGSLLLPLATHFLYNVWNEAYTWFRNRF